jgi:hypothetical protein
MDISRLQVPFDLPEPHFEDESTVVTARQVVPLDRARLNDRRRRLLAVLPLLLAATVCGALGAVTVNYLERQPVVSTPATQPAVTQKETEPRPLAVAPPSTEKSVAIQPEPAGKNKTDSEGEADAEPATTRKAEVRDQAKPEPPVASAPKPVNQTDPRQIVRQRRVHAVTNPPPSSQNNEGKSGGAGRIQDLFGRPNP